MKPSHVEIVGSKQAGRLVVATQLVELILPIKKQSRAFMLLGDFQNGRGRVFEPIASLDQQRNVELGERCRNRTQVLDPEIDFTISVIVLLPLLGRNDKQTNHSVAGVFGGVKQSRIVGEAKVASKPD